MVDLRKLQGRDGEDIFIRKIGGMLCLVIHERDGSKAAALLEPTDIPALCRVFYEAAGLPLPAEPPVSSERAGLLTEEPVMKVDTSGGNILTIAGALNGMRREATDPLDQITLENAGAALISLYHERNRLTEERPADPVEVARAVLEDIRRTAQTAGVEACPISSRWGQHSAEKALAALRQGRGE